MPIEERVQLEIETLHQFLVQWFSGQIPSHSAVFHAGFLNRFDPQCLLIPPSGKRFDLKALTSYIRELHDSNPDFRIAIRDINIRQNWDNYLLVTYEEWQINALQSKQRRNGRLTTALFRNTTDLSWLHIHETWLPADIMAAGPYDF